MKELIELLRYTELNGDRDPQNYVTNLCGSCYLCEQAADALEKLQKQVPKWIPVTERLPEKHDRYLVLTPSPFGHKDYAPWLAWYEPEVGFIDSDPEYGDLEMDYVTHWMPLPEPPKGE